MYRPGAKWTCRTVCAMRREERRTEQKEDLRESRETELRIQAYLKIQVNLKITNRHQSLAHESVNQYHSAICRITGMQIRTPVKT